MISFTKSLAIGIYLFFIAMAHSLHGQVLSADGQTYEINFNGSFQEFTIPDAANLNGNNFVTFFAKGADGGKRKSGLQVGKGGGGAKATGTFEVGTFPGELKPGARIRFIVGEKGTSNRSGRIAGAGGGGGSGIIYTEATDDSGITCTTVSTDLADAASCWVLLVAGGGGGGAFGSGLVVFNGKNGRDQESGGDGEGDAGGNGGSNGNGGSAANVNAGSVRGGGGGGAKTSGTNNGSPNQAGRRGKFTGGEGGNNQEDGRRGGFGYGGGGGGADFCLFDCVAGAGGGGGYSGGGGSDEDGAGGGGSFVNALAVLSEKEDGRRDGSPDNGRITYQFEEEVTTVFAKCKEIEVILQNGTATIVPNDVDNGSIVEPGESIGLQVFADFFSTSRTFTCADIGENTIPYAIVSTSGFSDACTAIVEVIDGDAPILTCPSGTIQGSTTLTQPFLLDPTTIGVMAVDACGGSVELYLENDAFTCADLGINTVTIFGEDESDNTGSCDITLQLFPGNQGPSVTCPSDITVNIGNANNCPAIVTADQLEPTVTGNCSTELTYEIANSDGDVFATGTGALGNTSFPLATNTVTYIFGANNLVNPRTCSFTVSLSGQFFDDSLLSCDDDRTINLTEEDGCSLTRPENLYIPQFFACFESVEGRVTYTDPDGVVTTEGPFDGLNPGDREFGIGVSELTFTANYGTLSETCSFTITINDAPPIARCKDLTRTLGPNQCSVSIPFADFDDGSSDNCGPIEFLIPGFIDCSSGTCVTIIPQTSAFLTGAGEHIVSFSVRDENGNISPCTQTVTVIDETAPQAICKNITVPLGANCEATVMSSALDGGSTDNCVNFLSFELEYTDCSGGTPCVDYAGVTTATFTEVGVQNVILIVRDEGGNTDQCSATITLVDDTAPQVNCKHSTVQLDENGQYILTESDVFDGGNDDCGAVNFVSLDIETVNCSNTDSPVNVTVTAADENGNPATCMAVVTVEDNTPPFIDCAGTIVALDANGTATILASDLNDNNGSTDACGPLTFSFDEAGLETTLTVGCEDLGILSDFVYATDANGNTSSPCPVSIGIKDEIAPQPVCNAVTVALDESGSYTFSAIDMLVGGTDNCGTVNFVSASPASASCSDIGTPLTVSVTVNDGNGNMASCDATVTVVDDTPPFIDCVGKLVTLNAQGEGTLQASELNDNNGSTDACSDVTFSFDEAGLETTRTFTCDDLGGFTDVVYATDASGNVSTPCSVAIIVGDEVKPQVSCTNATVQLDENGTGAISISQVGSATDNCRIILETVSRMNFGCEDIGNISVTYTAVDVVGNSSECTAQVTVIDNILPMPTCKNTTVQLDANGQYTLTEMDVLSGGMANCGVVNFVEVVPASVDCASPTNITATVTVNDGNGNTNTCMANITIDAGLAAPAVPTPNRTFAQVCIGQNSGAVRVNNPLPGVAIFWEVIEAPAGASFSAGTILAPNVNTPTYRTNQDANGRRLRIKSNNNVVAGTYRFKAFAQNTLSNCISGLTNEVFTIEVSERPPMPVPATATNVFCASTSLSPSLANTGINVNNSLSANEKVVWVLTAAPQSSTYPIGSEFTTDDCGDAFKNFGDLAVANNSKVIRIQDVANAPVGTYTFEAYITNCATGCSSTSVSGFSITIYAPPAVEINAEPDGALCLGQEDVMYDATITSMDGGTYTYAWCAFNAGDGSGNCFNGFSDNTSPTPTRNWTSSTGPKSVGVTVASDVSGCTAETLYSFEVVAPTEVECPADQMVNLVTDPASFDCTTSVTFTHPSVANAVCGPYLLTIAVDGGVEELVTPGADYTLLVDELGAINVVYRLTDGLGGVSTCSFDIIVDGLPCGFVDSEGINCSSSSTFDQGADSFELTADDCVPVFPHTADATAFTFTELCGDGEITALVSNLDGTGYAGVLMLDSDPTAISGGAAKVSIGTNTVDRIRKEIRVVPNYPAFPQEILSFDQFWVRLNRTGDTFRGSASTDGLSWTPYIFQNVLMDDCILVGLYAYGEKPGSPVTAFFEEITISSSNNVAGQIIGEIANA
ncbi:MAG: hypothetical protein AAF798_10125 [Bacteroidota bacterium]